jgi:hypothetical protein
VKRCGRRKMANLKNGTLASTPDTQTLTGMARPTTFTF